MFFQVCIAITVEIFVGISWLKRVHFIGILSAIRNPVSIGVRVVLCCSEKKFIGSAE